VLRALGIPCGVDFMVSHAKVNAGHSWAFILDRKGKSYISDFLDGNIISASVARHLTAKVYRRTFSLNRVLQTRMSSLENDVPGFFKTPHFFDITHQYFYDSIKTHTIIIPRQEWYDGSDDEGERPKILYLCVPSMMDWTPVAWAEFNGKKIRFREVKSGGVFRIAAWEDKKWIFYTNAFIAKRNTGELIFLNCNEEKREEICLFSKYDFKSENFTYKMIGGVFEADTAIEFNHPDTLLVIREAPERLFVDVAVHFDGRYRYVRYKGAKSSHCDVAEITFYAHENDTVPLTGKVISDSASDDNRSSFEKAVDGNPYTSYHAQNPSNCWVGMEFGQPENIGRIVYTPRNRDNFIRNGDFYELFYMDWEWISLDVQRAVSDSLVFGTVPSNVLLYLKNHTRGKEERPFMYDNGKQRFW
jgi:hypothetical protein